LLKSKLVARKQGRSAQKASAGEEVHPEISPCFRRRRRAHRSPRRAPLHQNCPARGEKKSLPALPKK